MTNFYLLLLTVMLSVIGQFLMKIGVSNSNLTISFFSILKTIFSPFVFFGLISYALSVISWIFVLQKLPLSTAYPFLSLGYIIVVLISSIFLKETLTLNKIFGSILIMLGIFTLYK